MKKENYYKHIRKLYQKPEIDISEIETDSLLQQYSIGFNGNDEPAEGEWDDAKSGGSIDIYYDDFLDEEEEFEERNPYFHKYRLFNF